MIGGKDNTLLYRFKPEAAIAQRFEKIGGGPGYIWGSGVGFVEYVIPARQDRRRVGRLVVRAHLQPVLPVDAKPADIKTRVTLFVNGTDCGSRLIPVEPAKQPLDSGMVHRQLVAAPARRPRLADHDSLCGDGGFRLALRHQHLQLAGRLRRARCEAGRG